MDEMRLVVRLHHRVRAERDTYTPLPRLRRELGDVVDVVLHDDRVERHLPLREPLTHFGK